MQSLLMQHMRNKAFLLVRSLLVSKTNTFAYIFCAIRHGCNMLCDNHLLLYF